MTHTPGPWIFMEDCIDNNIWSVSKWSAGKFEADTILIATVSKDGPFAETEKVADANARLIAAAPELLSMVAALVGLLKDENGHHFVGEAIQEGKALWKKASGKTWIEEDDNDELEVEGEQP